jgi:putative nucleotidyltransferase with HDIG domain
MSDTSLAISQKLAAAVEAMPAFPKSVQQILEMTRQMDCTPKELVQVIESDPVVTVKILKVVNSAYFALPKQVTSINHAVVFLGFNTIKNLALSIAAIGMLPAQNEAGFDTGDYLLHSLSTATIAKRLALRLDDASPMDCFIAGLLHDFGKVVLAQFMPQEFKPALQKCQADGASLHLALRQTLGIDHASIGAMLAQKWRFSPDLVAVIACQFDLGENCSANAACVFVANQISKKLSFGFAGNTYIPPFGAAIRQHFGTSLDEVIVSLDNLEATFEEVKIFAKV